MIFFMAGTATSPSDPPRAAPKRPARPASRSVAEGVKRGSRKKLLKRFRDSSSAPCGGGIFRPSPGFGVAPGGFCWGCHRGILVQFGGSDSAGEGGVVLFLFGTGIPILVGD